MCRKIAVPLSWDSVDLKEQSSPRLCGSRGLVTESMSHTLNQSMALSMAGTDDVRTSVDAALATLEESLRRLNHEVNHLTRPNAVFFLSSDLQMVNLRAW